MPGNRLGKVPLLIVGLALGTFAQIASAADFALDASHTSVHFAVSHFDISLVRGHFGKVAGAISFDPEKKTGAVDVRIDPDSLDTGNATLDQVLRSPQFLDTGQFRDVRFGGTGFVFDGDKLTAVDGTLILCSIAHPVRLTVQRFVCKDVQFGIVKHRVCGGELATTIKRSEFGMKHFLGEVGDDVMLSISVEATRQ